MSPRKIIVSVSYPLFQRVREPQERGGDKKWRLKTSVVKPCLVYAIGPLYSQSQCIRAAQDQANHHFTHRWGEGSQHPTPSLKTYFQLMATSKWKNHFFFPRNGSWLSCPCSSGCKPYADVHMGSIFWTQCVIHQKHKEKELEQEKKTQS